MINYTNVESAQKAISSGIHFGFLVLIYALPDYPNFTCPPPGLKEFINDHEPPLKKFLSSYIDLDESIKLSKLSGKTFYFKDCVFEKLPITPVNIKSWFILSYTFMFAFQEALGTQKTESSSINSAKFQARLCMSELGFNTNETNRIIKFFDEALMSGHEELKQNFWVELLQVSHRINSDEKQQSPNVSINITGSNVGGFSTGDGGVTVFQVNQVIATNLSDITRLIEKLKTGVQGLPNDVQESIEIHLEDLTDDIADEKKHTPKRIRTRLIAIWGILCTIAVGVAGVADFSNNVLELSQKLNIPLPIELIQKNSHILPHG